MIDYNEISYTEIEDCIEDAKKGLLSPYWQGYAEREVDSLRLTDARCLSEPNSYIKN